MTTEDTPNSSDGVSKTLIRTLIIVGIGIPVLVELLTFFNLVNVQLFEDEPEQRPTQDQSVQVVTYAQGDTLFADSNYPVIISAMRINVSAQEWVFELQLHPSDTTTQANTLVNVDSLELKNSNMLHASKEWTVSRGKGLSWTLPNGQIPVRLYMTARQPASDDSVQQIRQEVPLGNIPVRYTRESGQ